MCLREVAIYDHEAFLVDQNLLLEGVERFMLTKVYMKEFEIHTTPLEQIKMNPYCIEIDLDDIMEERYRIIVKPYVAFKIVTSDCVHYGEFSNDYVFRDGRLHRHILEIEDSEWIHDLRTDITDAHSSFLQNVRHYVLLLQDNVIEIVAESLSIEKIPQEKK